MSLVFEPPLRQKVWSNVKRKRDHQEDEDVDITETGAEDNNSDEGRVKRKRRKSSAGKTPEDSQSVRHRDLKYQHFTVLNASLFKCLQSGDYTRASRIFGMLIRFEPPSQLRAGQHVDIRRQNLWSVGAEILLRRASKRSDDASGEIDYPSTSHSDQPERYNDAASTSTEQGFADTKAFFERLILQYPTKKLHDSKTTISKSTDNVGSARIQDRQSEIRNLESSVETRQSVRPLHAANIEDVSAILERVEDVVRSPPYDRNPKLARMHGELRLWMADVSAAAGESAETVANWKALASETLERAESLSNS